MKLEQIEDLVNNWPTKHKEGFTNLEITNIINTIKVDNEFSHEKFDNAMMGNTCLMREGQLVMYHWDVIKGIQCGIENRDLNVYEWD